MGVLSLLALVLVGGGCGALETRHLAGRGLNLNANMALGAVGALAGGLFFTTWGQLAPGLLAPVASGAIGAAIVLPPANWIATRFGRGPAAK